MKLNGNYTIKDHFFRTNDVWANFKYRLTLNELKHRFADPHKQRIYDLGSGSGYFCGMLSNLGYEVIGVEPDRNAFDLAVKNHSSSSASFLNSTIERIDLKSDADVVIMHDVLEHIDAEHATVVAVSALLKDSGLLIMSVPASELLWGHHDCQLGHYRRYSKSSLRRALGPLFHIHSIRYLGAAGIIPIVLFSKILKTPYPISSDTTIPMTQRIFGWLLHVEWLLHLPFGGGLMVVATKRDVPSTV